MCVYICVKSGINVIKTLNSTSEAVNISYTASNGLISQIKNQISNQLRIQFW